jgi:tripartite-type tricarboxylate transporter receptor subunit TctC
VPPAAANAFPGGPVQLIDPFGAGGGPDLVGRALAGPLANRWGEPVTVVNRPGAGSTAAPALVKGSAADGRTVLVSTSAHAYASGFSLDLPYDPLEDFTPVAPLTNQPYVLVAGAHIGIRTLTELIAVARTRPGSIRYGSTGTGTASHVGMELLRRELAIDATHVPAQAKEGIAETIDHVIVGESDLMIAPIAITLPHLGDDRLIPLGVTTLRRSRVIPDVVTLSEAGPSGFRFDFPIWYGTWVSSMTPPDIVWILAEAIASALTDPELQKWLIEHDGDPLGMSHAEFARFVRMEAEVAARIAAIG